MNKDGQFCDQLTFTKKLYTCFTTLLPPVDKLFTPSMGVLQNTVGRMRDLLIFEPYSVEHHHQ